MKPYLERGEETLLAKLLNMSESKLKRWFYDRHRNNKRRKGLMGKLIYHQ